LTVPNKPFYTFKLRSVEPYIHILCDKVVGKPCKQKWL